MSVSTTVREEAGWTIVAVQGEVDISGAPRLRDAILQAVGSGVQRLVLDLSAVPFIDSTGLGVLVAAHKRLTSTGGELRVVGSPEAVLRTVRATGLHLILHLRPTVDSALTD